MKAVCLGEQGNARLTKQRESAAINKRRVAGTPVSYTKTIS
jgi:hypothetical protein